MHTQYNYILYIHMSITSVRSDQDPSIHPSIQSILTCFHACMHSYMHFTSASPHEHHPITTGNQNNQTHAKLTYLTYKSFLRSGPFSLFYPTQLTPIQKYKGWFSFVRLMKEKSSGQDQSDRVTTTSHRITHHIIVGISIQFSTHIISTSETSSQSLNIIILFHFLSWERKNQKRKNCMYQAIIISTTRHMLFQKIYKRRLGLPLQVRAITYYLFLIQFNPIQSTFLDLVWSGLA